MTLRPYQEAAVVSALDALTRSGSAVLQMPTGAGKTRAATEIIDRLAKPVWFVCHRQEIERQAAKAFAEAGIDFGILSPRAEPDYGKPVQIVSVGTLAKRISELPLPSAVIWDECHHVAAKSWAKIRDALKDAQHLGLTATPERLDGKGLGEWFAELIVGPSTRELIDGGHLSEFRYFAPSEPDLTGAKLRAGDYRKEDVAKAMNMPVLIGDAVAEYKAKADGKRAIVFCASVEASQAIVDRFNAEGVPAAHIDGSTPTTVRDAAIEDLAASRIKVLSNVEVFTEGFDLPAIDAVFLLRPTKSVALFLQMIGRALRKAEGKDEAIVFDHSGLWLEHGWFDAPWDWSLDGGARKRRLVAMGDGRLRRCPHCKEVRQERVEACGCGYEFPTGREIGEYDGQLWELRSAVPDGFVTQAEFARMQGVTPHTVENWRKKGMPSQGALINLVGASEWLSENWSPRMQAPRDVADPESYISPKDFERMHGLCSGAVYYLRKAGLPCAKSNGWVHAQGGEAWLHTYRGIDDDEVVTKVSFAERHGVGVHVIDRWTKFGLPRAKNGGVPLRRGNVWVAENGGVDVAIAKESNLVPVSGFAKLCGVTPSGVKGWTKAGLPRGPRGTVLLAEGLKWLDEKNFKHLPPRDVQDPWSYESPTNFDRRVGNSGTTTWVWRKRGLPIASNGWVHIQRGLEWVRDNTKIVIPPEAWPAANDNAEAEKVTREMHAEARALLDGKPKKFGEAA